MAEQQTQQPSGASTGWEQEKARMEAEISGYKQQISGLSNERNNYRQKAESWERVAGEVVEIDQRTGLPMGLARQAPPVNYGHPLAAAGIEDPNAVDAHYRAMFTEQMNKAGYVTAQQAQQMAQHAAQVATGNAQVWRMVDRLTARKEYHDLEDTKSKLYERTTKVLQERQLARPMEYDPITGQPLTGAVPLDRWAYRDLESLRLGADLAAMELEKEAKAAAEAAEQASAAQGAAALSVGATGTSVVPKSGDVPLTASGEPDWDKMRQDTQARADQLGIT